MVTDLHIRDELTIVIKNVVCPPQLANSKIPLVSFSVVLLHFVLIFWNIFMKLNTHVIISKLD